MISIKMNNFYKANQKLKNIQ